MQTDDVSIRNGWSFFLSNIAKITIEKPATITFLLIDSFLHPKENTCFTSLKEWMIFSNRQCFMVLIVYVVWLLHFEQMHMNSEKAS